VNRFTRVMSDLRSTFLALLDNFPTTPEVSIKAISEWHVALAQHALRIFLQTRESYVPGSPDSAFKLLGRTSALYSFVRGELGVKVHYGNSSKDSTAIGTEIGKVFHAWKTPRMAEVLVSILTGQDAKTPATNGVKKVQNGNGNGHLNGHANGSGGGYVN